MVYQALAQTRKIDGRKDWLNTRRVWQRFPTEEELRETPPEDTGTPPIAVGVADFLQKLRVQQTIRSDPRK